MYQKRIIVLFSILFIIFLFVNCGQQGKDGKAYVTFDWDDNFVCFTNDNIDIPNKLVKNYVYESLPGTYNYRYYYKYYTNNAYIEKVYKGKYTIEINKGEPGGFFTDGEDGLDKYYNIFLSSTGEPTIRESE